MSLAFQAVSTAMLWLVLSAAAAGEAPPDVRQEGPPGVGEPEPPAAAALRREMDRLRALLPETLRRTESSRAGDAAWAAWIQAADRVVPFEESVKGVKLPEDLRAALCKDLEIDPEDELDPLERLQGDVAYGLRPYPAGRIAEIFDAWIDANAPAFAAIDAVLAGPHARNSSPGFRKDPWRGPPFARAFFSARELFGVACSRDLARRDVPAAVARWSSLARMAKGVSGSCPESGAAAMVSAVLLSTAGILAERIVEHPEARSEDLETIQALLAGPGDFRLLLRRQLRGSAGALAIQLLAEFGRDLGPDAFADYVVKLQPEDRRDAIRKEVLSFVGGHPSLLLREETVRLLGERIEALIRDAERPWHDVRPEAHSDDLRRELEPWPKELELIPGSLWIPGVPFPAILESRPPSPEERRRARDSLSRVRNPVGKWVVLCELTALEREAQETRAMDLGMRLTLLAVALSRYERLTGGLPAALSALAERGILREIPEDPATGKPFLYSREKRLVWSVGPKGEVAPPEKPDEGSARSRAHWIPSPPAGQKGEGRAR